VKLVADDPGEEPGRDAFRKYYWQHANMYATSYCFAEALSAFKRKFLRKEITESQYIANIREFIRLSLGTNLCIDEVPILDPKVIGEAERLIKTYKIDFLDCFQIVTIMHGRFSVLGPNSQSLLITADKELADVALRERVRVWNCRIEPSPV
jgi:predicted nucleic acid-binding protein